MAFRIAITEEAEKQLNALPTRERRTLEAAVRARLRDNADKRDQASSTEPSGRV
jgi:mRNA-degrading endonuclease RelE of RelBE toxin-antitoxin system